MITWNKFVYYLRYFENNLFLNMNYNFICSLECTIYSDLLQHSTNGKYTTYNQIHRKSII